MTSMLLPRYHTHSLPIKPNQAAVDLFQSANAHYKLHASATQCPLSPPLRLIDCCCGFLSVSVRVSLALFLYFLGGMAAVDQEGQENEI